MNRSTTTFQLFAVDMSYLVASMGIELLTNLPKQRLLFVAKHFWGRDSNNSNNTQRKLVRCYTWVKKMEEPGDKTLVPTYCTFTTFTRNFFAPSLICLLLTSTCSSTVHTWALKPIEEEE
mmetsp:Transcript_1084/g.1733  ORF Transcript_1084/g.1733 Transcript_1084/m.1733 type:complete len:120 (-) Transcript_1084:1532-1891(-)